MELFEKFAVRLEKFPHPNPMLSFKLIQHSAPFINISFFLLGGFSA
jgi:hypothetical protein